MRYYVRSGTSVLSAFRRWSDHFPEINVPCQSVTCVISISFNMQTTNNNKPRACLPFSASLSYRETKSFRSPLFSQYFACSDDDKFDLDCRVVTKHWTYTEAEWIAVSWWLSSPHQRPVPAGVLRRMLLSHCPSLAACGVFNYTTEEVC